MARNDERFLGAYLRTETVGGVIILVAAVIALVWANSPISDSYDSFRHFEIGPLDIEHWAADGALAFFFFIAGLEVKRELVLGSLSSPRDAMVPIVAAVAGVFVPSLIFVAVNLRGGDLSGWAIPSATDLAFALAVLAVVGGRLSASVRPFLLTLAVMDDLVVIAIIALFYGEAIEWQWLVGVVVGLVIYWALQYRVRGESWLWYVPLAAATWWCMHESGVHATVAGVAMACLTRVVPEDDEDGSPAEIFEHAIQPWSAGIAVPLFALTAAGVSFKGAGDVFQSPVAIGAFLGLVLGKPLGILGGTYVTSRLTKTRLEIAPRELVGIAILGGVGFTVSLLVADLSYDDPAPAKVAVLAASLTSAVVGGLVLRGRSRLHALDDGSG